MILGAGHSADAPHTLFSEVAACQPTINGEDKTRDGFIICNTNTASGHSTYAPTNTGWSVPTMDFINPCRPIMAIELSSACLTFGQPAGR